MQSMAEQNQDKVEQQWIADLTATIVGAYVSHNTVAVADLQPLITTVGQKLTSLRRQPAEPAHEKPKPAVPIKRSIRKEAIVCLVCGEAHRTLKRHLASRHDLLPDAYRAMFDLNYDYPLVAPAYAAARSALAKKNGLGRKPVRTKPAKAQKKRPATKSRAKTGRA
ncbi:MAG: MucR family transcriptional regulator [Geminicoccaceae bacterium]